MKRPSISSWIRTHRSAAATAVSCVVIASVVAAAAVVSTGYTAQQVDLGDGTVWVSNSSSQAIGRANPEILELNSVMPELGENVEIVQSGSTVLVTDRDRFTVGIVDSATSTVTDTVPLPPDDPQVFLAGDTVAVVARATGEVWFTPLDQLADFDAESSATLNLGTDVVASIDPEGTLFAFSRGADTVYRMTPASSDDVRSSDTLTLGDDAVPTITSVGDRWAVLDAATGVLHLSGREIPVSLPGTDGTATGDTGTAESGAGGSSAGNSGAGGSGADETGVTGSSSARLQEPSAGGAAVLVADTAGLVAVPVDGSAQTTVVSGQSGTAAAPVVVGGCVFAAWSGGNSWRGCAEGVGSTDAIDGLPSAGETTALTGMTADAVLRFRSNAGRVLLNDSVAGGTWAVQSRGELINNWADLIPPDDAVQEEIIDNDSPPQVELAQQAPVAGSDEFGARPGRTSPLPVLLNDYDPNGDVLTITEVSEIDPGVATVDRINHDQQLQISFPDGAAGTLVFQYTISDGRGGTASAEVVVTVRAPSENSPPAQVRTTELAVEVGGRATLQVLDDWVDPDGDAIFLQDASVPEPDAVAFKPVGSVIFSAQGSGADATTVTLAVSDGAAAGMGSIAVTVQLDGAVPLVADGFVVLATAGTEVTVEPLKHVRGGSGDVRLGSVPDQPDVILSVSYDTGTFTFASTVVGTHYLEYVVTDGDQSTTGTVRVDVAAPALSSRPITVPKTVFVQTLRTEQVDVAGTDIDPGGSVLVVTGVDGLTRASGVSAEVLEQRYVRVRLDAPLEQPLTFGYTVSNGLAEAQGTITVIEIPVPPSLQPPIATDDEVTVRVGASIDIPVLANDEHPDGATLTLNPALAQQLPEGAGLLFGSGNVLRYLAPERPGNFLAVYEIAGPDGQTARAQLRIAVRESDANTNAAPLPSALTARVLAGSTVTIPVPLSGIDPDGDTVQLLGQETSPERGSVIAVGADSITYRAGDYSSGTDTFQYAVIDALGARATGEVRVGISARQEGARNPIATVDEVTARPGSTVSVQVLANDSDPDGSTLTVVSAEPNDDTTLAEVDGDLVVITPADEEGVYGVVYTIENASGGTSSNFVRVVVDPDAPLSYPVVSDTVLGLSDILDREEITVDVLAGVFFADGDPSELTVDVYPGFEASARVTADKSIELAIADDSQIIPFRVTHPDDENVFSFGFIRVPGFDDALPQIDRTAPELTVVSEETLTIELADYVLAAEGRSVQLTDTSTVRATHGNGDALVVDSDTLVFTSADRYFGAASISFEVTDGQGASDPDGRRATLVLPITVLPRENQPPVFTGAVLEIEPAEERQIDLTRLTTYPYPDDVAELQYTVVSAPEQLGYQLDGQSLTITADAAAPSGSVATLVLGVRDGATEGQAGNVQVTIVPSTRPLARPATDTATVKRGESTTVDVLANDNATNPFPGTPLRVVAIRGLNSSSLPAGVTVTPSADNSTLSVTVSDSAEPVDTSLQYQVQDASSDPGRAVWGTVRISVQDRPDPVTAVRVTEFGNRTLTVVWSGGAFNNSPITGYRVVLSDPDNGAQVSATDCSGSRCTVPTSGNGRGNAVRVSVIASNAIGASDASSAAGEYWSDVVPAEPEDLAATPLDNGLRISWRKPASAEGATAITRYVVAVDGVPTQEFVVPERDAVGTVYSRDIVSPSLTNGATVEFTVSARNQASAELAVWTSASASGVPAGAPIRASAPTASVDLDDAGVAVLSWDGGFTPNGRAVTNYYAAVFTGEAPACVVEGNLPGNATVPPASSTFRHAGTATSTSFSGLTADTAYQFVVYATNGMGCTASETVQATPRSRPGTVTSIDVTEPEPNGTNRWDIRLTEIDIASGYSEATSVVYRLSGSGVEGSVHGPVDIGSFLESSNGSHYGSSLSVQVKACTSYPEYNDPVCSTDWSSAIQVGTPVENTDLRALTATIDPEDEGDDAPGGVWSWTASPDGAYSTVTYRCGARSGRLIDGEDGACSVEPTTDANGTASYPDLTITITVDGREYERSYAWTDFD